MNATNNGARDLNKGSRAIRRFLIGCPPDLSQDGQFGKHNVVVALLAAEFINGHEQVLKTWDSLRHHEVELTRAVEGRLLRTTDPTQLQCTDLGPNPTRTLVANSLRHVPEDFWTTVARRLR